jgi:hypothetical protein
VLASAVQGLQQISKADFGLINPAESFNLLQAQASHTEITPHGLQLVEHMVHQGWPIMSALIVPCTSSPQQLCLQPIRTGPVAAPSFTKTLLQMLDC